MPNNVGGSLGGSSLVLGTSQSSFDVRNESDVISLLRLVHLNQINPDVKNHLRDLIFAFRQDQNDTQFTELQEAFSALGVALVKGKQTPSLQEVKLQVNQTSKVQVGRTTLGNVYRQPRFAPVLPKQNLSTPIISESVQTPVSPQTEVAPIEEVKNVIVKEEVISQNAETVTPTSAVPSSVQTTNHLERIKEIKKIVNEKVGNPVNLIDANNEIGREYMNALLDAMKKSNGGQPQEVDAAMVRLENAFTQVQEVIISGKATVVEVAPVVTATVEQTSIVSEPVHTVVEEQVVLETQPEIETLAEPVVLETQSRTPKMASVMDNLHIEKQQTKEAVVATNNEIVHSVAKEKQLQDLMRANREKVAETYQHQEEVRIAAMDPLQVPEVTAGLGQLLSEWNLFKSSGIFGTGPSGKDHVLYLKLAPLTMATVIAGRFEGATPRIKQSITDYMNGWRYEEGVVHEHGETFEHYLRRVIKHILEKQKKK